ncbi:uncharacterized protein [Amphiura filiformis]|uniref:uncharacterized protein n=1 Tax=Amphiura filiformis TaxID=82378 RepID=UPI003B21161A
MKTSLKISLLLALVAMATAVPLLEEEERLLHELLSKRATCAIVEGRWGEQVCNAEQRARKCYCKDNEATYTPRCFCPPPPEAKRDDELMQELLSKRATCAIVEGRWGEQVCNAEQRARKCHCKDNEATYTPRCFCPPPPEAKRDDELLMNLRDLVEKLIQE